MSNTQDRNLNVKITASDDGSIDKIEGKIDKATRDRSVSIDLDVNVADILQNIRAIQARLNGIKFNDMNKNIATMAKTLENAFKDIDLSKLSNELVEISKKATNTIKSDAQEAKAAVDKVFQGYSSADFKGKDKNKFNTNLNKYLRDTEKLLENQKELYETNAKNLSNDTKFITYLDKTSGALGKFQEKLKNAKSIKEVEKAVSEYKNLISSIGKGDFLKEFEKLEKDTIINGNVFKDLKDSISSSEKELNTLIAKLDTVGCLFNQKIGKFGKKDITFGSSITNLLKQIEELVSITKQLNRNDRVFNVSVKGLDETQTKIDKIIQSTKDLSSALANLGSVSTSTGMQSTSQFTELDSLLKSITQNFKMLKSTMEIIGANINVPQSVRKAQFEKDNGKLADLKSSLNKENDVIQKAYTERAEILSQKTGIITKSADEMRKTLSDPAYISVLKTGSKHFEHENDVSRATKAKVNRALAMLEQYISLGGKVEDLEIKGLDSSSSIVKEALKRDKDFQTPFKTNKANIQVLSEEIAHMEQLVQIHKEFLNVKEQEQTTTSVKVSEYDSVIQDAKELLAIEKERLNIQKQLDNASKEEQKSKSVNEDNAKEAKRIAEKEAAIAEEKRKYEEKTSQKVAQAYDLEIKRREKQSKDNSIRLQNQMKQNEKLNQFKEWEDSLKRISTLEDRYAGSTGYLKILPTLEKVKTAFSEINAEIKKGDTADFTKIEKSMKDISSSVSKVKTAFEKLEAPVGDLGQRAAQKTTTWMNNNTRALKVYGNELNEIIELQKKAMTMGDLDVANNKFNTLTSSARANGLVGKSWKDSLKNTFGLVTEMFGSFSLVNRADDIVRDMVGTIHDVDDALTDLKMATNVSDSQAESLMETYSKMGRELKATGVDVSTAATDFMKQGETIANAQKLAHDSIVLSKVGDLSAEESTKYLTSAMKGYKVEAQDALSIVDKLSAVDMASATDVGGLAEAMSKVAVTAKDSGIEMSKLLGYIATVGEVTQADMGSVGNAFKTIFTRMSNIKAGKLELIDEDGTTELLSDVELTLKNVGIDLRKTVNDYNNFGDVFDNLAKKWDGLSEVQQSAIAKAFAGTRQTEYFRVLMKNYDSAEKYMKMADESSGYSLEKFSAYQDSLSGKVESFKNSFQTLSNTVVGSDFLKGIVDAGTGALDILDSLIEKFGVLSSLGAGLGIYQGFQGGG